MSCFITVTHTFLTLSTLIPKHMAFESIILEKNNWRNFVFTETRDKPTDGLAMGDIVKGKPEKKDGKENLPILSDILLAQSTMGSK